MHHKATLHARITPLGAFSSAPQLSHIPAQGRDRNPQLSHRGVAAQPGCRRRRLPRRGLRIPSCATPSVRGKYVMCM